MAGQARKGPGPGSRRGVHRLAACRSCGIGLVVVISFIVLIAGSAQAGYAEGMEAFARGEYDAAYRELHPLAEAGEAGAQFTLGFMYDFGQGVPQNTQEAIWWYRNAAEQDIAVAHFSLGEIYERGRGTPRDLAAAYRWYSLAVQGLPSGEIRESVEERRDAVLVQMDAKQIALAQELLGIAPTGVNDEIAVLPPADQSETDETDNTVLIVAVQTQLELYGYRPRWQAGVLDPETRDAIRAFEIETGRAITGTISEELLDALRAANKPKSQASLATKPASGPRPQQPPLTKADANANLVTVSAAPTEILAEAEELERPTGPAGGPLILEEEETELPARQLAELPAEPVDQLLQEEMAAAGSRWDLRFIDRQIARLDAIVAGINGPSAAVPGWDELETWERETRGLLAARLGQERAESLSNLREDPVPGDPLGNLHRTADAFRTYLSGILQTDH